MANFLSPIGNSQFVDVNGNPLTGGKVYTYLADSSTPAATFTTIDRGGVIVQQANPIILNSLGLPFNSIWLLGGISYKFVVKDSVDAAIETIDGITGVNDSTVTATPDQWVVSGFAPTYIAPTVFSVVGDKTAILTVGRRIKTNNTALVIYSYISASTFSAGITTVTVVNDALTLDLGLSLLYYSFLSSDYPSLPNSTAARSSLGAGVTGNAVFIAATATAAENAIGVTRGIATNGWRKNGDGLTVQWGTSTGTTNASSAIAVTFPVAFTTAAFTVIASNGDTAATLGTVSTNALTVSNFNATFAVGAAGVGTGVAVRVNWTAYGN